MPSLRDLQRHFAEAMLAPDGTAPAFATPDPADAAERIAIYRHAWTANCRHALRASYPVVLRLVGEPFFDAAADAFARALPSRSGDLNAWGDAFGDFLAGYPHAAGLPYLADVARLEWAVDEAQRAADTLVAPEDVLAAPGDVLPAPEDVLVTPKNVPAAPEDLLAALTAALPERLPEARLRLDPSCRLVASAYPVLHIWQANQPGHRDDDRVDLDEGGDTLLVRRDADGVSIARTAAGLHALLAAFAAGANFGAALDAAQRADAAFDLGAALRTAIASGIIAAVDTD